MSPTTTQTQTTEFRLAALNGSQAAHYLALFGLAQLDHDLALHFEGTIPVMTSASGASAQEIGLSVAAALEKSRFAFGGVLDDLPAKHFLAFAAGDGIQKSLTRAWDPKTWKSQGYSSIAEITAFLASEVVELLAGRGNLVVRRPAIFWFSETSHHALRRFGSANGCVDVILEFLAVGAIMTIPPVAIWGVSSEDAKRKAFRWSLNSTPADHAGLLALQNLDVPPVAFRAFECEIDVAEGHGHFRYSVEIFPAKETS